MTVCNKAVLSSYNFNANFLLLSIQSAVCLSIIQILSITHRPFTIAEGRKWFVVALSLVGMIYTGSKALQYLSISLFTILKNVTIIIIAVGERHLFNGPPVTILMYFSFSLIIVSSIVAGWQDISFGLRDGADVSVFVAYSCKSCCFLNLGMLLNVLSTSYFTLIVRRKLRSFEFNDIDTTYYNNLIALPILAILSLTEYNEIRDLVERYSGASYYELYSLWFAVILSGIGGLPCTINTFKECVYLTPLVGP
jgi:GDP-mannose transporter